MSHDAENGQELMTGQLAIWNALQLEPVDPIFNIAEYLAIRGDLNVEVFVAALRRLLGECDSLHACFRGTGTEARQHWMPPDRLPIHVMDVTSAADPAAAAVEWMRTDMNRSLDVANGPLATHAVFRIAERRYFWYMCAHHLVGDGFSATVLVARLSHIYATLLAGDDPAESEDVLESSALLLEEDRRYRRSEDFQEDRRFWLDLLADCPRTATISGLPVRRARFLRRRHLVEVDRDQAARMRSSARRLRTSLAGLAITAGAACLHQITGADDLTFGIPVLGRANNRLRGIPGTTTNIVPVRSRLDPRATLADLVRATSRNVRASLKHQRYHQMDMLKDLHRVGSGPVFGTILNVMSFDYQVTFGDCTATAHNISSGPVDDVQISIYDRSTDAGFEIAVDVNPETYSAEAAEDIARRFLNALEQLTEAAPTEPVGRLQLLSESERHQVLSEWNDTGVVVGDVSVLGLFGEVVGRDRGAVAVVCGDERVSYGELDVRSDRLAGVLRGCGVGLESVVGVVLERSVDLVVALLAVWK
ncbi:condensation domain-containing protein, partial [Streptomyces sp. NPDC046979]|uniref:condensation domain-containing protein n=1 Tax=Streptomyces sp. NPDC046979 TaxID=3154604 RepID=UPI0033F504AB